MHRIGEYILFFVILLVLQVLLFDNLNLTIYVSPLAYVAFLVMLPTHTGKLPLLLLGFLTGVIMDLFMGTAGLNTIASTATAFLRPGIMNVTLGRDNIRDSETPLPKEYGNLRWLRYAALMVGLHCLIFFVFEAMSFKYLGFTMLRMLCSAVATLLIVILAGAVYPARR